MADYQEKFRDKPMFFRTLTHGFGERLEIPTAFVKNIIPEKIATVWDPLGKPWSFRIQRDFPNFYFKDGWQSFAAAYNLEIGSSLLFCYEGDMDFSVIVFDTRGCRKECIHLNSEEQAHDAIQKDECKMNKTEKTPYTDVQSVAIKLACILRRNVNGSKSLVRISDNKTTEPGQRISRECENNSCEKDIGVKKIKAENIDLEDYVEGVDRSSSEYEYYQKIKNTRTENVCLEEDRLKRVDGISRDSEHDLYEKGVDLMKIKTNSVDQENHLKGVDRIQRDSEDKSCDNVIKVKTIKTENVDREHHLEGVDLDEPVQTSEQVSSEGRGKDNVTVEEGENLERAVNTDLKNKIPDQEDVSDDLGSVKQQKKFVVTLKPRNLEGHFYLYIPVKFKEEAEISEKNELILKDPKGNYWTTCLIHSTKNRSLISKGWKEFCVNNGLRTGDVCEFQFSDESKVNKKILQVKIFRKSEKERLAATKIHRTCGISLTERPSFWITISPFVLKYYNLQIPNAFVAARKMFLKRRATLRDQNGNIFTMILGHTTRNRTLFTNGWKKFSVESNLKPGDICEFTCECDEDESQETEALQVRVLKEPPSWYEKSKDSISLKKNKKRKKNDHPHRDG